MSQAAPTFPPPAISLQEKTTGAMAYWVPHRRRCLDCYIDEGDLVIQAETLVFCVHSSTLIHYSRVFKKLLDIPPPPDAEIYDTRRMLLLPDREGDVRIFLVALFHGLPFRGISYTSGTAACLLRVATKYKVKHLQEAGLAPLRPFLPTTLGGYDELLATFRGETLPYKLPLRRPTLPELVEIASAIDEAGSRARALLPAALVLLSTALTKPEDLYDEMAHEGGRKVTLNANSCRALVIGMNKLSMSARTTVFRTIYSPSRCPQHAKCNAARLGIIHEITYHNGYVDPFVSFAQLPGADSGAGRLCSNCSEVFFRDFYCGRTAVWNDLPQMLGLPAWQELLQEK